MQPVGLDLAESLDLFLGHPLQFLQTILGVEQILLDIIELGALVLELLAGRLVVVERRRTGLGDHADEHVGLDLIDR